MLMKNCNAFDFTHNQIFKTLTRDNLGGGGPLKWGALCICTLCTFLRPPLHCNTLNYNLFEGSVAKINFQATFNHFSGLFLYKEIA